jgi:hypothetical protein
MKRVYFLIALMLSIVSETISAQSLRYFEFTTQCGHGNWQDTSFIAATDDPDVINSVLTDLGKPYDDRRFISGSIDHGDGGYNHNADHWFLWHFIPGEWDLAEMAIEVCDGCPFSDVDADTAYWISNIGIFCPWSGKPAREIDISVFNPSLQEDDPIIIYPNPATSHIYLQLNSTNLITLTFYNSLGQKVLQFFNFSGNEIDLPNLKEGIYFLRCENDKKIVVKSLLICL